MIWAGHRNFDRDWRCDVHPEAARLERRDQTLIHPVGCVAIRVKDRVTGPDEAWCWVV